MEMRSLSDLLAICCLLLICTQQKGLIYYRLKRSSSIHSHVLLILGAYSRGEKILKPDTCDKKRNKIHYFQFRYATIICSIYSIKFGAKRHFFVLHYKQTLGSSMAGHTITCLPPSLTLDLLELPRQKQGSSTRVRSVLMCQGNVRVY